MKSASNFRVFVYIVLKIGNLLHLCKDQFYLLNDHVRSCMKLNSLTNEFGACCVFKFLLILKVISRLYMDILLKGLHEVTWMVITTLLMTGSLMYHFRRGVIFEFVALLRGLKVVHTNFLTK
jgi:hypothetical protein